MTERTKAWQCEGCGRLESQHTCIGICRDRAVEVVSAADYEAARREIDALRLFVRQLALIEPRGGEWERSYRALQARALRLLEAQGPS
jgi:hypothetical protein